MRYLKWFAALYAIGLLGFQATLAHAAPQNGWWWNPNQSGRGYSIEIQGDTLFMAGYLYENDGRATWLVSGGTMQDATTYAGRLLSFSNGQTLTGDYKAPWAPSDAGAVTLQFSDDTHATLTWPGGSIAIERFRYSTAPAASFQPRNGWWWNETESGRGFFIEVQGDQMFMAGYMYEANGNPVWYVSGGAMTSPTSYQGDWLQFANGQTLTGPYVAPSTPTKAGTVRLEFPARNQANLTLSHEIQRTDDPPLDTKSISKAGPKVVSLTPFITNKDGTPKYWGGAFKNTKSFNDGVADLVMEVNGTVEWLSLSGELVPLVAVDYKISTGSMTVSVTGISTLVGCKISGTNSVMLSSSDGHLNVRHDGIYSGAIRKTVSVPYEVVCPTGPYQPPYEGPVAYAIDISIEGILLNGNMFLRAQSPNDVTEWRFVGFD